MQSPSLDAAQAMGLGARGASLADWTGLHGLDLVGWRGSTLMQASALTLGQPKRLEKATLARYMVDPSLFGNVVSGCRGWRCFVDE